MNLHKRLINNRKKNECHTFWTSLQSVVFSFKLILAKNKTVVQIRDHILRKKLKNIFIK